MSFFKELKRRNVFRVGWTFMSTEPIPTPWEIVSKMVRFGTRRWSRIQRHGALQDTQVGTGTATRWT